MGFTTMRSRSSPSLLLIYIGLVATALTLITLGLVATVKASIALASTGSRDKTVLEQQSESSREIRRALATKVVVPPLPPITARPARDIREATAMPMPPAAAALPPGARDARAMERSMRQPQPSDSYPVADRHAPL